jgi:hypothetical protein
LIELDGDYRMDRNFEVVLEETKHSPPLRRVIFSSPDEGLPIGTEQFIWSRDSQHLLLIGQKFYYASGTPKVGDDRLYLLLDLQPERLRCNASQQTKHLPFVIEDVVGIEWAEEKFQGALTGRQKPPGK